MALLFAGAQVEITDEATGVVQTAVASSAGEYRFPDLPLGLYTVSATSSGFETLKVEKVQVSAGSIYSLPLKLAVASQATTVEVNAAGVALDTTSVTQTTDIPTRTIQDTPINGRDYTQFLGVVPGFAGYSQNGGAGFASVNGTRTNTSQLADRRHRQQRLVVEHSGSQPRRRERHRGYRVTARCDRPVFLCNQLQPGDRSQSQAALQTWSSSRAPTSSTARSMISIATKR